MCPACWRFDTAQDWSGVGLDCDRAVGVKVDEPLQLQDYCWILIQPKREQSPQESSLNTPQGSSHSFQSQPATEPLWDAVTCGRASLPSFCHCFHTWCWKTCKLFTHNALSKKVVRRAIFTREVWAMLESSFVMHVPYVQNRDIECTNPTFSVSVPVPIPQDIRLLISYQRSSIQYLCGTAWYLSFMFKGTQQRWHDQEIVLKVDAPYWATDIEPKVEIIMLV